MLRNFRFYPKCYEKPLKSFKQESDMMIRVINPEETAKEEEIHSVLSWPRDDDCLRAVTVLPKA